MTVPPLTNLNNRKEACKTFVDQTKLLTSLASAFIVAPAVILELIQATSVRLIVIVEAFFVVSVLAGYLTIGSIADSQHKGQFNVYEAKTMTLGRIQFFSYLFGIIAFVFWFLNSFQGVDTGN